MAMKFKIVGAGISGLTVARKLSEAFPTSTINIIDSRLKIGGNCSSSIDPTTGIEVHDYGPHIFHTSNRQVWEFVNSMSHFNRYQHHVIALHAGKSYFMPFNLHMMGQFFGIPLAQDRQENEKTIQQLIGSTQTQGKPIENLEDQAISLVGKDLYEAFVKNYTTKQWGKPPTELSADIIKRIPVRFDYNIKYYLDEYEGIPTEGYQKFLEQIVTMPNIHVKLNAGKYTINDYLDDQQSGVVVVYTGALDEFFGFSHGTLQWRSLEFVRKRFSTSDYQGNSVVNYVDGDTPYTRSTEYVHFHPETTLDNTTTLVDFEKSQTWEFGRERFYAMSDEKNVALYKKYLSETAALDTLFVVGRLGKYKYLDMDDAIAEAFVVADEIINFVGKNS